MFGNTPFGFNTFATATASSNVIVTSTRWRIQCPATSTWEVKEAKIASILRCNR